MNQLRSILLIIALGFLFTPMSDTQALLEEFVLAQAEDAANLDFIPNSLFSITLPEQFDHGPSPSAVGFIPSGNSREVSFFSCFSGRLQAASGHYGNRPLFLLYHNLRFGDCLA